MRSSGEGEGRAAGDPSRSPGRTGASPAPDACDDRPAAVKHPLHWSRAWHRRRPGSRHSIRRSVRSSWRGWNETSSASPPRLVWWCLISSSSSRRVAGPGPGTPAGVAGGPGRDNQLRLRTALAPRSLGGRTQSDGNEAGSRGRPAVAPGLAGLVESVLRQPGRRDSGRLLNDLKADVLGRRPRCPNCPGRTGGRATQTRSSLAHAHGLQQGIRRLAP